ncbi:TIGR03013 family XrtA/PEP-CTERM system glycosyltransferase [Aliikangiella coralliicola]|uniref:TIGR03013 family PEP-CTERM/XrtA system glycosyltransferase n=1 Tax=Aliikangiella coralliicola TaxID=2592383 RepID=A0A545U4Q3_9GAMM|nr:TIGR03013 family XrtA/PEP-CTERM system glycosyltransferase [Aliikangiella coralliicola]TQV84424.1 TIGR03013 family PEP-CTERM/XrtA system glycosyltransferase [Aliikangiella coralliicola]
MSRIFGHYIPRSLTILAFFEFVAVLTAFYSGVGLRFSNDSITPEFEELLHLKAAVFSVSVFLSMVAVGLYSRSMREGFGQIIVKLVVGMFLAFFALVALYYLSPSWFVGRGAFVLSLVIAFFGLIGVRYLYSSLIDTKLMTSRVLVIGTGAMARQLQQLKRRSDWRGITLVGFFHLRGDQDEVEEEKIIRSEQPLSKLVTDYGIDELIVAVDEQRKNYPVDEIIGCKMKGIQVTEISDFFEKRSGRLQIDTLHPSRFIFIEGFNQDYTRIVVKRFVDICLSLLMLLITVPIYPILIFLIKKESGWNEPVFYSQVRVGQDEENFVIHKFRSMVVDAEQQGAQWASKNDARVTKVGNVMRKTRLDELPQLWNVLKGDMSFVGPRPERPEFVEKLAENIPYYRMRHRVKPGITGWAQVCYPYGDDEKDAKEKLQYDLYYIKNYSVFLDLAILAQTAQVILWQKGAR